MKLRGFYAILDVAPNALGDAEALALRAEHLLAGGPCCLQLRAKDGAVAAPARALERAARQIRDLCRPRGVPFCVNDRLDVALAVGADVVHLGQDDLPLEDALRVRALTGRSNLVVGFSTHNPAQARAAAAAGADYIGFGPVFSTASKHNPDPVVGLEMLAEVCRESPVPVVAIGGITLEKVIAVAQAGAAAAALIAAVAGAPDPSAAGRRIAAAFG